MARPTRQGVDYFPLDIHLDDKFKFIEIKFKLEGFAILIKLLQKIYSYGYWYSWTEDEMLIFADENRVDIKTVEEVVREAIERDIFNKELYEEYEILTSQGIQKRYKEIVRRRKDVEVMAEYLLIDNSFGVNADIMPTPSEHDDIKSTQSKVKESKVKKSKEDYAEFITLTENEYEKLIEKHGELLTRKMIGVLDNYKGSSGKTYKSDYRAILSWVEGRVLEENKKPTNPGRIGVPESSSELGEREEAW